MNREAFLWILARLRAMPVTEYPHRLRETVRRAPWRNYRDGWARFEQGDGALPMIPGLRVAALSGVAQSAFDAYAASTERVRSGELELLGRRWPRIDLVNDEAAWHLDPVSGAAWPSDPYCFDIPRRRSSSLGDVKFVWELNRLQMLPGAALVALRRDDPALVRWCVDVVASWMKANPPFRGVNWSSGIELALRVISVSLSVSLLPHDRLTQVDRSIIRSFCLAHLFWIFRYPSLFSSANNHLLAEAVGVFTGAALIKDFPDATKWQDSARRTLEREIHLQVLADGIGAEQSTAYSAYVLELLIFAGLVGRSVGTPLSCRFDDRIRIAADALAWFSDAEGNTPAIGDDDETRIIPDPGRSRDYPGSVLACAAGYLKTRANGPSVCPELRTALFDASDEPPVHSRGLRTFNSGGYTVLRQRYLDRCLHLVFDHGPLGYLSLAAHGHADTLAIWLSIDGHPVFVDAGTYLYSGPRRNEFRGAMAHNTLSLGAGSSLAATPFSWTQKASGKLEHRCDGPLWKIVGSHDGYLRRHGVRHVRKIAAAPDGLVITDQLVGRIYRPCEVSVRFLLDPSLNVELSGSTFAVTKDGDLVLEFIGDHGLAAEVERRSIATSFSELAESKGILLRGPARAGELRHLVRLARTGLQC